MPLNWSPIPSRQASPRQVSPRQVDPRPRVILVAIGDAEVHHGRGLVLRAPIVGSGIVVTLWDPETRVIGMAHVVLPTAGALPPSPASRRTARWADVAIPGIVRRLRALGARPSAVSARLIGAANGEVLGGTSGTLARIEQELASAGVSVVSRVLGGELQRSVKLDGERGDVTITLVGEERAR